MGNTFSQKAPPKKKAAKKKPSKGGQGGPDTTNTEMLASMAYWKSATEERIQLTPEIWKNTVPMGDAAKNPAMAKEHEEEAEYVDMKDRPTGKEGDLGVPRMGALTDASVFAAMYAISQSNPQMVKDLIQDNGDGTFDVSLYIKDDVWSWNASETIITVDTKFPAWASNQHALYGEAMRADETEPVMWAMLIEKAVAIHHGTWDKIAEGELAEKGENDAHGALTLLTGKNEATLDPRELGPDGVAELFQAAADRGWPVTVLAKELESCPDEVREEADRRSLVSGHTYAAVGADTEQGKVDLMNPWGALHLRGLDIKLFMRWFSSIHIAKVDNKAAQSRGEARR